MYIKHTCIYIEVIFKKNSYMYESLFMFTLIPSY